MYELAEFLEPNDFLPWLIRVIGMIAGSYVLVWLVAIVISRLNIFDRDDALLRVYFGWMIPLAVHCMVWATLGLFQATYFVELDISLWYCLLFVAPVVVSAVWGQDHCDNALVRLKRLEKRQANGVRR